MNASFTTARIPEFWFGENSINKLPGALDKFGSGVLLVTGQSSWKQSLGLFEKIEFLKMSGQITWHETIAHEPSPGLIDSIRQSLKGEKVTAVVAIGGGSALDAGKALAAMLPIQGSVADYLEEVGSKNHPGTKLPFIAIPTTAGTGSEATKNAVLSKIGPSGYKKSLRHENFIPDLAIIDPALTFSCPPFQTAMNGMDAFSQLIESYTSTKATPFTDLIAYEGIKLIRNHLTEAIEQPDQLQARSAMSYAAFLSGIALANAGLGLIHGFASEIGARANMPHGAICGSLLAVVNKFNIHKLLATDENKTALHKYARIGRLFFCDKEEEEGYYAEALIDVLEDMTERLGLPKLSAFGVNEDDLPDIALTSGNKNNPVTLNTEEKLMVLKQCFRPLQQTT